MDAFYASVEQRDHPELRGKALAVGHGEQRGVVAAASYEARRKGVHSAMPSVRALRICPELIMVEPRFAVYKQVSGQMHEIFHEYTDKIEPISLDEAFLDVTENKVGIDMAVTIARDIKWKIRERLGLTASAGVSYNKFLAKVASDLRKPDGLCTIHPLQAQKVIDRLPVECFWGVGPVTARRMHKLGLHTGADLKHCSRGMLMSEFGKAGSVFYNFCRGIDNRPVEARTERKSLSCEHTLHNDISSQEEIEEAMDMVSADLARRIDRNDFEGVTLTLKVRFSDFTERSRSITMDHILVDKAEIYDCGLRLFESGEMYGKPVRLIGLGVSNPHREMRRDLVEEAGGWRQLLIDFDMEY